jgi:putative peptide zinc metalloprotease protein
MSTMSMIIPGLPASGINGPQMNPIPRLKFRTDLLASEHTEAGRPTMTVIEDPVSRKYFRLTPYEFHFLAALDGKASLDEAIRKQKALGRHYPPDYAQSLVNRASEMGLLLGSGHSTANFIKQKKLSIESAKKLRRVAGVYFLFIPVWNPDRFLGATVWVFKALCNRWTGAAAAALSVGALWILLTAGPMLDPTAIFSLTPGTVLYLWVTIALAKLVHEFAHAYSAKSLGLHVPEMGVAFLIFFPCLYCNTTDAWRLADRKERMAISAAGIIAEALLAMCATYLWYFTRSGIVNSLAAYLMTVSLASTILFNGNPLLKFDGYFILTDLLRIPNLAQKSWGRLRYLFMNGVLGVSAISDTAEDGDEAVIFTAYGVASFIYRFFLYTGIVVGVYYRFDKFIGVILGASAFALFVISPLVKGARILFRVRKAMRIRPVGASIVALIVLMMIGLLITPFSAKSAFPCRLESAMTQKLTVPLQTTVMRVFVREGGMIEAGKPAFQLEDAELRLSLANKSLERDMIEREIEMMSLDDKEASKVAAKTIELNQADHEIRMLAARLKIAREGMAAPFDAVAVKLDPRLCPGFGPGEGAVVGELRSLRHCTANALISEDDVYTAEVGRDVELWFPVGSGCVFRAKISSVKPYNEPSLKDSPLAGRLGGDIPVQPRQGRNEDAPLVPHYVVCCPMNNTMGLPLGMAGKCVIASPPRSLISRLIRAMAATFNQESLL